LKTHRAFQEEVVE